MPDITFSSEQFATLFPFYILLDENDVIESYGKSIDQLCRISRGHSFFAFFECIRNPALALQKEANRLPVDEMVLVHSLESPLIYLKGKIEHNGGLGKRIFFGAPCYITRSEEIEQQFRYIDAPNYNSLLQKNANPDRAVFENIDTALHFFAETEKDKDPTYNPDDDYAITLSNTEGKVIWCNENFLSLSGRSMEEVYGKRPRESMYGERSVFIASDYVDKQVKKGMPFYFENIGYHKNGNEYWFGVTVQPVYNPGGEIIGRLHLIKDISFTKLKEQREEESESLLKLSLEVADAGVWSYDQISKKFSGSEVFRKLTNLET